MKQPRYRTPTAKEELEAHRRLLFDINFHRCVTMNHAAVMKLMSHIDSYVGAHSDHNGERPEAEIKRNVNAAFWEHIVRDEAKGRKP